MVNSLPYISLVKNPKVFFENLKFTKGKETFRVWVYGRESYIKNADEEKVRQASEWVVEHNLWKKRREDVVARLIRHREEGAQVYIASSVVEPFIEPFAERIGAQVVGTPTEIVDGRLRTTGELAAKERKIEQVLSRLGVDRLDVAYGDTWMDIPLLEHADHPVAVYPDEKLKSVAMERGWEIFGSRRDK